ncbi:hypothetical protein [Prauserella muralis]|uniref:Uncharacterized protein n=1 Tax=Prauserella muralis TaxID=588067 RepID=A0A2V4AZU4_9PSEU|nr:hypothetical protein [Prauserella muralis]PXY27406.1 hypothetical protein BAY60_13305 [Prauserella muralis]TWE22897.1 hypothetical protein FHX69_4153 [Prauserella muralis]
MPEPTLLDQLVGVAATIAYLLAAGVIAAVVWWVLDRIRPHALEPGSDEGPDREQQRSGPCPDLIPIAEPTRLVPLDEQANHREVALENLRWPRL